MDWRAEEILTLRALIDRIIPADDFPSASGNRVDNFIVRLLQSDLIDQADQIRRGLASLNDEAMARFKLPFAELAENSQDELLGKLERETMNAAWSAPPAGFFELMVALTKEGYYTDASSGSNLEAISWKMIGYDPRVPPVPVGERWTEQIK